MPRRRRKPTPEESAQALQLTAPEPNCSCGAPLQKYQGHCLNCKAHIGTDTAMEWHVKVKAACPRCGRPW